VTASTLRGVTPVPVRDNLRRGQPHVHVRAADVQRC
jgi:hypothetical protein